jgi:prepilin-type N-terminal cleavage/methylation domain-containing protein
VTRTSRPHAGGRNLVFRLSDRGFTLIEMLIVLTIMGVLGAVAVVSTGGLDSKSQIEACKADSATIRAAQAAYYSAIDPVTGVARHQYAPTVSTLRAADFMSTPSVLHEVVTRKVTLPATDGSAYHDPITGQPVTLLGVSDPTLFDPKTDETRDDGTFYYLMTKPVPAGSRAPCVPDQNAAIAESFPGLTPPPTPDVTKPWLLTLQNAETVL